jgi:cobyrinic acid a,c-diamide synthase
VADKQASGGSGPATDKQASGRSGAAPDKQASGSAGKPTGQQAVYEAGNQADDTSVRSLATGDLPVALARDEAFCFIYADTLARLERLGVCWVPFSPLREGVPEGVAGIYLPGGYPELHARELAANGAFLEGLRRAGRLDLPLFAECGGYMVLAEALVDAEGRSHAMAGLVPGRARMTGRLQGFGYKRLRALGDNLLCRAGAEGRAHEFHHSVWEGGLAAPAWRAENLRGEAAEEGFARGNLLASYGHLHFGAQPDWAESWVMRLRYHGSLRKEEP